MRGGGGGGGISQHLEKSQKYRVEKIPKLPSQHSILGHYRHARETPFKLRFAGGSIMARL